MAVIPGHLSPLADFFFGEPPQGMGFKNNRNLATAICQRNTKAKPKQTVENTISDYFRLQSQVPEKFARFLRIIVGSGELRAAFDRALQEHNDIVRLRQTPIEVLRHRYSLASDVIFIALEPISANIANAPQSLVDFLEGTFEELFVGSLRATMCVASETLAHKAWNALKRLAKGYAQRAETTWTEDSALDHIDERLKLYVLPKHLCVFPTFVFDPDTEKECGFVWFMPWDWRSPTRMPLQVLAIWKEQILAPIQQGKIDGRVIPRISLADMRKVWDPSQNQT